MIRRSSRSVAPLGAWCGTGLPPVRTRVGSPCDTSDWERFLEPGATIPSGAVPVVAERRIPHAFA